MDVQARTPTGNLKTLRCSSAGYLLVDANQADFNVKSVTLTTDTNVYASGDVLAATQSITSAVAEEAGEALLKSIVVHDLDDQGKALDLVFLQTNVSIGTENAAASIAAENAGKVLGVVNIAEADWVDMGTFRVATKTGIELMLKAASASTTLYIAAISRGTGTYASGTIPVTLGLSV